jgi:hypothetical protein
VSECVEGEGGNREVPPLLIRRVPGDTRGRQAAVCMEEEGGSRERYASWDDTREP